MSRKWRTLLLLSLAELLGMAVWFSASAVVGIWAMAVLRRSSKAVKLAGGQR